MSSDPDPHEKEFLQIAYNLDINDPNLSKIKGNSKQLSKEEYNYRIQVLDNWKTSSSAYRTEHKNGYRWEKEMKVEVHDGEKWLMRVNNNIYRRMVHRLQVFMAIKWAHEEVGHSASVTTHNKVRQVYDNITEHECKVFCDTCPTCNKSTKKIATKKKKAADQPIDVSTGGIRKNRRQVDSFDISYDELLQQSHEKPVDQLNEQELKDRVIKNKQDIIELRRKNESYRLENSLLKEKVIELQQQLLLQYANNKKNKTRNTSSPDSTSNSVNNDCLTDIDTTKTKTKKRRI